MGGRSQVFRPELAMQFKFRRTTLNSRSSCLHLSSLRLLVCTAKPSREVLFAVFVLIGCRVLAWCSIRTLVFPDCRRKAGEGGRKGGERGEHPGTTETSEGAEGEPRAYIPSRSWREVTCASFLRDTALFLTPTQQEDSGIPHHTAHANKGECGVVQGSLSHPHLSILLPLTYPPPGCSAPADLALTCGKTCSWSQSRTGLQWEDSYSAEEGSAAAKGTMTDRSQSFRAGVKDLE